MHAPNSSLLSFVRLTLYLTLTFALMPVQMVALLTETSFRRELPRFYHRLVLRLFGFRIIRRGLPVSGQAALFVSNHISYIDIEVLGSIIDGSFIAKSDVQAWPIFGLLAKLQRTVFVDRRRSTTQIQRDSITERLEAGDRLILFPEGTSGTGDSVLPFRSALFSAAAIKPAGKPVIVQPVTIAYVRLNAIPIGRDMRPYFAWYGDMTLAGHFWTMLGLGRTEVVVQFHEPVTLDMFGSRKQLAEHCEKTISRSLAAANSGRLKPDPALDADAMGHPHADHGGNLAIGA